MKNGFDFVDSLKRVIGLSGSLDHTWTKVKFIANGIKDSCGPTGAQWEALVGATEMGREC